MQFPTLKSTSNLQYTYILVKTTNIISVINLEFVNSGVDVVSGCCQWQE